MRGNPIPQDGQQYSRPTPPTSYYLQAPPGGVYLRQRQYRAGQFIPGDTLFYYTPPRGQDPSARMKPQPPAWYDDEEEPSWDGTDGGGGSDDWEQNAWNIDTPPSDEDVPRSPAAGGAFGDDVGEGEIRRHLQNIGGLVQHPDFTQKFSDYWDNMPFDHQEAVLEFLGADPNDESRDWKSAFRSAFGDFMEGGGNEFGLPSPRSSEGEGSASAEDWGTTDVRNLLNQLIEGGVDLEAPESPPSGWGEVPPGVEDGDATLDVVTPDARDQTVDWVPSLDQQALEPWLQDLRSMVADGDAGRVWEYLDNLDRRTANSIYKYFGIDPNGQNAYDKLIGSLRNEAQDLESETRDASEADWNRPETPPEAEPQGASDSEILKGQIHHWLDELPAHELARMFYDFGFHMPSVEQNPDAARQTLVAMLRDRHNLADRISQDEIMSLPPTPEGVWLNHPDRMRMETQEPAEMKLLDQDSGMNGTYRITFPDGTRGMFKPVQGEAADLRNSVTAGQYNNREVAASLVADVLGFDDLVPKTTFYSHGDMRGSIQAFAEGAKNAHGFDARDRYDGDEDAARAALFDYIIGHSDRHTGNWMISPEGKLVLIDNGLSFPVTHDARDHKRSYNSMRILNHSSRQNLPLPDVSGMAERWPEVERVLKLSGLGPEAIARTRQRFEEATSGRHQTVGDLPAFWFGRGNEATVRHFH